MALDNKTKIESLLYAVDISFDKVIEVMNIIVIYIFARNVIIQQFFQKCFEDLDFMVFLLIVANYNIGNGDDIINLLRDFNTSRSAA